MNVRRPHVDEVPSAKNYSDDLENDSIDIRAIFVFLWRSKWIVAFGAIVGLGIAALLISAGKPTYTATASVLFQPETLNVVDIEDVIAVSKEQSDLSNQIEILRSTNLLNRVTEKLRLWEMPTFNPSLAVDQSWPAQVMPYLDWRAYVPWAQLVELGLVAPPTQPLQSDNDKLARDKLRARKILQSTLGLRPIPDTQVIRISHTSGDRTVAMRVANAVAQEYITAQLDTKLAATREATVRLSDRVVELEDEVNAAEAAVTVYESSVTSDSGQTTETLRRQLGGLNDALSSAVARTVQAQVRYIRARQASTSSDSIAGVAEFQALQSISAARNRERELLSDRAELLGLVSENHERARLMDVRIEAVRTEMRSEAERIVRMLENEFRAAQEEQSVLRGQIGVIEQSIADLGSGEVRRRQLQREADASRLIYENFLSRLKEITQQQSLEEADAVIISPAERPASADSASSKRIAGIGLVLGAGLSLGFAVLVDRLNNTFRTIEELETSTGIPVVGALPRIGRRWTRNEVLAYVRDRPTGALPEAIRSLCAGLLLGHRDRPPQVVMVTSTVSGEGKSTTGLLLAQMSAQMGKRTIIVDCNIRRPSLYTFVGSARNEHRGLRGLLDGSVSLDDAVLTDERSDLDVLTSRTEKATMINPADILWSDGFADLLAELRAQYDLVVLDAPAALSVADARIIAKLVDTTLYCVRWASTPRDLVADGLREFRIVNPNILGLVATMIDTRKAARYGSGRARYKDAYVSG